MPSQIDVIFNADTGRYVANVNAATGATNKSAEAVAAAKNKILESFEAQIRKAESLGASQQQLQRIAEKSASQMSAVTEQNANRIIANLDRIAQKQRQVASELSNFKVPKGNEHDITDRMRASALIRGGGVRSAENFATQFDAFNKLSTIAFPVIGAATLVAEIVRGVAALKEMYDAAEKLPEAIRDGWEGVNAPVMLSVDNMRKVNDELEIAHEKFAHKPENLLALAIDEDRVKADQLAASARAAAGDIRKMLAENSSGFSNFVLTGQAGTKVSEDAINGWFSELQKKQAADRDARRSGTDTEAAAQARKRDIAAFIKQKYAEAGQDIQDANSYNANGIQNGNLANFRGARERLGLMMDQQAGDDQNTADTVQAKKDAEQRQRAADAKEATQKQQAAARKAMEEQRRQWELQDDLIKQGGGNVARDEVFAWDARIAGLKQGSEQYIYVQTHYTEALDRLARQQDEESRKAAETASRNQRARWENEHIEFDQGATRSAEEEATFWDLRVMEATNGSENYRMAAEKALAAHREADRQSEAADKARNKAALERGQQQTQYAEAVLGIQRMTGQISQQDAAIQLANIHTEQYRQKLAALGDELARQQGIDPNSAGTIEAQAAVDKAGAERRVQVQQDAAAMAAQTWQGALKNANAAWVQDAQDSAKQVVQLYQQAFEGLNSNLVDLMTGEKSHFGQMFKGVSKTLAGDALKRLEAPAMKGLNSLLGNPGKPDGSEANPLHVKLAGGAGAMGGGSTSALGHALFPNGFPALPSASQAGSDSGDDDSDAPIPASGGARAAAGFIGVLGNVAGMFFGGHRALGGRVQPGVSYDVGEMGREEFVPDQPGTIVPTNQLGRDGASYTINVAQGVTPEQMHMHVQAALAAAHPHVVRASVAAMQDHQARHPVASR